MKIRNVVVSRTTHLFILMGLFLSLVVKDASAKIYNAVVQCQNTPVLTVPSGKIFKVYSIIITNDYDNADNPLIWLLRNGKSETNRFKASYNYSLQISFNPPIIYKAGETVGVIANAGCGSIFVTINGQ